MLLKVMNFNICCGDDPGGNTVIERAPRVAAILEKYTPDIIGLQEYTPVWEPLIRNMTGGQYEIFNKYRAETSLESTPILWKRNRFECIKRGFFWLSDTPNTESKGWDELFDCFRICEYAVLREIQSGICFAHMNTHFGFGDRGQVASAKLIYQKSKTVSDFPTFITGDFNMSVGTESYKEMTEHFTDVNSATACNYEATFHNYGVNNEELQSIFPDLKAKGQSVLHIDHCFVSNGITPINQYVIKDMPGGGYPSDHYALISEIVIK